MKIEELDDSVESTEVGDEDGRMIAVRVDAKRALVGAGARILFYPTLLYNVFRNKIQADFRWWDQIDQFLLLGAVPFPKDVPRLKQLGVGGVITLNEPYETLVPTSLYNLSRLPSMLVSIVSAHNPQFLPLLFWLFTILPGPPRQQNVNVNAHGIDHLVIPTRDYLFAPSFGDIDRAVDFIHRNTSSGQTTYVHCKAGRGRSTTIVLCYLVEYKHMSPTAAFEYVRSRRPRVLLAPSQWKAVQEYERQRATEEAGVLITKADLEGYHSPHTAVMRRTKPMMARLSCLFASLRASGNSCGPVMRQLTEARAC